ncbi:MAG: hypothetical protein ACI849_001152, partial [Patiriisocius sp.]
MKKIFLLLSLLVCSISAFSQTKNIIVSWGDEEASSSFATTTAPTGKNISSKKSSREKAVERFKITLSKETINYGDQWEDTGFANPNSLQITNIRYGAVSSKELELVTISKIPNTLNSKITSKKGRGQIYTILSLSPLVKVNGQIKKV